MMVEYTLEEIHTKLLKEQKVRNEDTTDYEAIKIIMENRKKYLNEYFYSPMLANFGNIGGGGTTVNGGLGKWIIGVSFTVA